MDQYRFGKLAPRNDYRTLLLENYTTPALLMPPVSVNTLERVYKKIKINSPSTLFPMDGNDVYGDCVVAGRAHIETVYNGIIGKKVIFSEEDVIKLYRSLTGGEDSGLCMLDFLKYWKKEPEDGHKILAYAKVDHRDRTRVKQAMQLFGALFVGINVQKHAIEDFDNNHKIWTPHTLTGNGHCIVTVGYDPEKVTNLTWGAVQEGTWAWWIKSVDECYAIIPDEALDPEFAPGFDVDQLMIDLKEISN